MIGIAGPYTTTLLKSRHTWLMEPRPPVFPGTPAASALPAFEHGDRIVEIDGVRIDHYGQIDAIFALHPDKTLAVTVRRATAPGDDGQKDSQREEPVTIELPEGVENQFSRIFIQPMKFRGLLCIGSCHLF